jgi:hypothetical protein
MRYTHTKTYELRWRIKNFPHYAWSEDKHLFNTKTGREIRKVINGGSIGYWIAGDFITLTKLRPLLERIPKEILPF